MEQCHRHFDYKGDEDPWVGDIRQCGYMVGIELVQNQHTKEPFPTIDRIRHHVGLTARTLGLLIRPIGNTMILMPPLSASLQIRVKLLAL